MYDAQFYVLLTHTQREGHRAYNNGGNFFESVWKYRIRSLVQEGKANLGPTNSFNG
jgi:hypothetical protein